MGYRKDYSAALALRLEGKTYGEIRKNFRIPKSTLSGWFSTLKINNKARKILESKKRVDIINLLSLIKQELSIYLKRTKIYEKNMSLVSAS